jgi:hypothetical protein
MTMSTMTMKPSTAKDPQQARRYFIGLDLGQAADYSALACIEKTEQQYALRHLERYPIGTPYPSVVSQVRALISKPPLAGCTLVPDATGVGRAVVDLLLEANLAARIVPVTITSGHKPTSDGRGGVHVPKKDLVAVVKAALQKQCLQVSASLPLAQTLVRELQTFTVQLTEAGNETFGAANDRAHDDLVLAISLALWAAENMRIK